MQDTERKILEIAKEMILERGILATEMKDIAAAMGCSRSTLYRHFPSKSDILLTLAQEALATIFQSFHLPDNARFINGYDALSWQLNAFVEALLTHVDEVTFLRDFDCVYTKAFPKTPSGEKYRDFIGSWKENVLMDNFRRGVEDGSIRPAGDPGLLLLTMVHGCLALAQRVLPREQVFLDEYGYGQELLRNYQKMMLTAVAAQ